MDNVFYIDFDTQNTPTGTIQAVKITIELETITDMERPLAINLCEHPLYKELKKYVEMNK